MGWSGSPTTTIAPPSGTSWRSRPTCDGSVSWYSSTKTTSADRRTWARISGAVSSTRVLLTDPEILAQVRRSAEVVFVDEYQDTDPSQVGPVSYTHLRAHETVLDHVCRL